MAIILGITIGDCEFAVSVGMIWPLAVPIIIVAFIIHAICMLLYGIIGFIRKTIKERSNKEK